MGSISTETKQISPTTVDRRDALHSDASIENAGAPVESVTLSSPPRFPTTLRVKDVIYGSVLIDSPCAVEIMDLPEFVRLKQVLQHGITALVGCLPNPPINRFDHSVGAMILVKHLGGSEESQLAALLHDVAHTALSHVVDAVFGYVVHEVEKHQYLETTRIPDVLRKHGFDPQRVLNEDLFPLLELPTPQICADRLDYGLRDSVSFGNLDINEAREIFQSLIAVDGRMALDSSRAASLLARAYLASDRQVWANPTEAYLYQMAAKAIELGLKEGVIQRQQLWTWGDQAFWHQLVQRGSPSLKELTRRINKCCHLTELAVEEPNRAVYLPQQLCHLKLKVRTVDPLVQTAAGLRLLSDLDPSFAIERSQYLKSREKAITFVIGYEPTVDLASS